MKNALVTVQEYNNSKKGQICMKFQNADGSFKKAGYVVMDSKGQGAYFKSKKEALKNMDMVIEGTDMRYDFNS